MQVILLEVFLKRCYVEGEQKFRPCRSHCFTGDLHTATLVPEHFFQDNDYENISKRILLEHTGICSLS